jgi:hypothetical protein
MEMKKVSEASCTGTVGMIYGSMETKKEFSYLSNLICKKILETTGPFELKLYKNDILNDG